MKNVLVKKIIETLEGEFDEKVELKDNYETIKGRILLFGLENINIYYLVDTGETTIIYESNEWKFENLASSFNLIESLL